MACARFFAPGRTDQGLRSTKARPELWPRPPKLKPVTVKTWSTASFSVPMKYSRTRSSTAWVRSIVAPGGVVTCTNMMPWSSSGRKEVGTWRKK